MKVPHALYASLAFVLCLAPARAQQTVAEATKMRTAEAQREAIKLYPALADSSSELNAEFIEAVKVARQKSDPVLSNPDWPLIIARRVASASSPVAQSQPVTTPDERPKRDCAAR